MQFRHTLTWGTSWGTRYVVYMNDDEPIQPTPLRTERVRARVTPEDKDAVTLYCERHGLTESDLVRQCLARCGVIGRASR